MFLINYLRLNQIYLRSLRRRPLQNGLICHRKLTGLFVIHGHVYLLFIVHHQSEINKEDGVFGTQELLIC
jgi:hypothetical protein